MRKSKSMFYFTISFLYLFIPIVAFFALIKETETREQIRGDRLVLQKHFKWLKRKEHDKDLYFTLIKNSKKYDLDPILVCSLITYESNGRKYAISSSKARGLMQIMPFHNSKNPLELYNEKLNIRKGCGYLRFCMNKAKGDLKTTLRFYNAGHNSKAWKYKNWKYVSNILNKYIKVKYKENFK